MTTTVSHLVRRVGELEVPAPGRWPLVRSSHVAVAFDHHDSPIGLQRGGGFEIADRPEDSTIQFELARPEAMTFTGRPTVVAANRHGLSDWSVTGTLSGRGWSTPMTFTVAYHGVFRSTGRSWAWFSGSGAAEATTRPRRWRRSRGRAQRLVVLDLLLDSPAVAQPAATALVA